jgi:hypothetical protein
MPDTTPVLGWPVPVLTDDPNAPQQITDLADAIEADVAPIAAAPGGDGSHSTYLAATSGDPASPDLRLPQSATTDILTASFTLTRAQAVRIGAKVLLVNTGASTGAIGICIEIDGSRVTGHGEVGSVELGANGTSTDQINTAIPTFTTPTTLATGSHTVKLRADRGADPTGVINARSTTTPNGRTYHPTSLTIEI